jgi:hypothetical protein
MLITQLPRLPVSSGFYSRDGWLENLLGFSLPTGGPIEGADWDHLTPEANMTKAKSSKRWHL